MTGWVMGEAGDLATIGPHLVYLIVPIAKGDKGYPLAAAQRSGFNLLWRDYGPFSLTRRRTTHRPPQ